MAGRIKYIPPQMDPLAGTSTRAARQNPLRLLMQDTGVLITVLPYLPNVILPLKAKDKSAELHLSLANLRDIILQCWLFLMETVLLTLAVPALLILPGSVSIVAAALSCMVIYLLALPSQGPRIAYSNMDDGTRVLAEQYKNERWLFVNGIATGHAGLQRNIDRISQTFGRAVIGIHNVTYGLPADLLECLVQRCLSFKTMDVRVTYAYLKPILIDPTVTKVVLIGHSQGGIIVSLAIDQLLTELPASCLCKLEIYTFGSAASHFSNPLLSIPLKADPSSSTSNIQVDFSPIAKHLIPHIEHYANEQDMVPRWGVLHSVCDILRNRYAGSVFVRLGASGHLFNQHYMDSMFPLPTKDRSSLVESFLDRIVTLDRKLGIGREVSQTFDILRKETTLEFGNGQEMQLGSGIANGTGAAGAIMTFARTESGRLMGEEARGKTVRELSRLWRYQGGRSPEDSQLPLKSPTSKGRYLK